MQLDFKICSKHLVIPNLFLDKTTCKLKFYKHIEQEIGDLK